MTSISGVGLSTADFANTLADLGATLDWFETLEIDSVELGVASLEVIGGCRIYPDRMAELEAICADRPFGYTLHGPIMSNFTDARHVELQKDACRACLEVSQRIGATAQVHHAGLLGQMSEPHRAAALALERDALAEIGPHAADADVILCVETLFGRVEQWTASPAELAAQIEAVAHPNIRATIDFSHAFINADERGYDALAELERLAPLTRHLHVHDSFGVAKTFTPYSRAETILFGLGDLHLPPGRGALPWEKLATLPFAGPTIANLELTRRHQDQIEAAVAWTRGWISGQT